MYRSSLQAQSSPAIRFTMSLLVRRIKELYYSCTHIKVDSDFEVEPKIVWNLSLREQFRKSFANYRYRKQQTNCGRKIFSAVLFWLAFSQIFCCHLIFRLCFQRLFSALSTVILLSFIAKLVTFPNGLHPLGVKLVSRVRG